jgi:hypothetical protein
MTLPQDVVGGDIAKDLIDCHRLLTGEACRVDTSPRALRRFAARAGGGIRAIEKEEAPRFGSKAGPLKALWRRRPLPGAVRSHMKNIM